MAEVAMPRRSWWVVVPPPPLFVAAFLAGRLVPVHVLPESAQPSARAIGVALLAAALTLLVSAPALFVLHRTTIIPHRSAKALVTGGPYRITRNPMYLALTIGYVGLALAMNALGPLFLLSVPLWILATKTIPFEEANLTRTFGEEYRAYQKRVRRWV